MKSTGRLTATHWGNFVVGHNGEVTTVSPSPNDPEPSPIGASLAATHDHSCRVRRPSIRAGYLRDREDSDTTRRGKEPFVEVEWDEALDIVAEAMLKTRASRGNEAIYGGSYGWASAGRFHHAQSQLHRFLRGFGGYTDSVNSYSFAAGEVIFPHVMGYNAFLAVLQSPSDHDIAENCELLVYFGGAAYRNSQVNPGGVGQHNTLSQIHAIRDAKIEAINVSPIRGDVHDEINAEWWPCRPNSDTAMMLAVAHTLIVENLHDVAYLDRYTVGFGKFSDYVLGKADGQPKDAEWAALLCELPSDNIRALARKMAAKPTLIALSFSIQRAEHGEQPYWAAITLAAMLGTIGKPGLGVVISMGVGKMASLQRRILPFKVGALPQGRNPVKSYIPVARITDMLERPGQPFVYNGSNLTYPDIDLIYWIGGNPFHHHQDINRLRKAWAHPRTIITHEINWTTAARHADIVLPCTSPLEREDFAGGGNDNSLTPMPRVLTPFGQARDDFAIFSDLARRLDFADEFTEGRNAAEWVEELYERTRVKAAKAGVDLPPYAEFSQGAPLHLADRIPDMPFRIEQFYADPKAHPLDTPSGKIEIFSERINAFGYSDCVGHAAWFDKNEWLGSARALHYPLHLLSNQPATRLHSQLDNGATSRNSKIQDREPLQLNPIDAEARGIAEGDVVRVFNDRGAFLAGVRLSDGIRTGVVQIATGAWYDLLDPENPMSLEVHGNPNAVTCDRGTSSLAQGPSSNSCLVQVERFEGALPPISVFTPPEFVGKEDIGVSL